MINEPEIPETPLLKLARGRLRRATYHMDAAEMLGIFLQSLDSHALHHGIPVVLHLSLERVGEQGQAVEIELETSLDYTTEVALHELRKALATHAVELQTSGEKMIQEAAKAAEPKPQEPKP